MKNYFKVVYELLNKENLTQEDIFSSLSFEDRKNIFVFSDNSVVTYDLIKRCNNEGIYLFTEEEFNDLDSQGIDLIYPNILLPKEIFKKQLELQRTSLTLVKNGNIDLLTDGEIAALADENINNNNRLLFMLLKHIKSDEVKAHYVKKIAEDEKTKELTKYTDFADVIATFSSDTYKQKFLPYVSRALRYRVVRSFADDHKKIAYSLALDGYSKEVILSSINDQEFARKLSKMPVISKKVLMRIKDENEREQYFKRFLPMIKNEDKGIIAASFSTREKQLELLKLLKTEKARFEFIMASRVLESGDIYRIAKEFRSDARKGAALSIIKNEDMKGALSSKLTSHGVIIEASHSSTAPETFKKLICKLNDSELKKLYNESHHRDITYSLEILANVKDKKWVMKKMENIELKESAPVDFSNLISTYSKAYMLNPEHLNAFVQEFGYGIFKYIKSERIREAINLDEESFKKYMQLFGKNKFICDEKSLKNSLDALSQQEYRLKYADIINVFPTILQGLAENKDVEVKELLNKVINESGIYPDEIMKFLGIDEIENNQLLEILISKLKEKNNSKTLDFVSKIASNAINNHRNRVVKLMDEEKFNNIPRIINESSMMDYLVYACDQSMLNSIFMPYRAYLTKEEKDFIDDKERLDNAFNFKRNPDNSKMTESLKKDLRLLGVIVRKFTRHCAGNDYIEQLIGSIAGTEKKINYDSSVDYEYILSILQQINSNQLKETIFNSQEEYANLTKFLGTTKILGLCPLLISDASLANVPLDDSLVANLINNYQKICQNLSEKSGFVDYLMEADYFNSESYRYENLFGREVFRYIKNNPKPNKATMPTKERFETAKRLVKKIFERKYMPIPAQNENYVLSNGKTLNARIGDIHSLRNLVHGEATGACMRIGGFGAELFNFCLLDDRGFHITFHNPKTGDFVSRVSGFRNGNTVFLNELRFSVEAYYNTEDLIECLHKVAEKIIEQTSNSPFPVENVVISPGCAMGQSGEEIVDLNVPDIQAGMNHFYSNVERNAIVLATTSKDKKYAPLKLNSGYKKYEGLKLPPTYYEGNSALRMVNHLKTLKEFLSGKPLEKIDLKKEEILACYATNTWGVYINSKKEIKTIVVDDKKASLEDMQVVLEELKGKLTSLEVKDAKSR